MTEDEFWVKVNEVFLEHLKDPVNRWRWGQTCMNVLWEVRPDLYEQITGTIADPWHVDVSSETYGRFMVAVTEGFNRTQ